MKTLIREPMVHFLLIGAGLFLLYGITNRPGESASEPRIVVDEGRIRQLAALFEKTWQRPPTGEELRGLVEEFVLEEVYYREALAMGLDRDDTIIRRRLRQKLEFFTDDAAALLEPTEEQLAAYLADHEDAFREPTSTTFRQVYFNPEAHGDDPETFVAERLDALRSGDPLVGDVSLLPESFEQALPRSIDGTFGRGFAERLDGLPAGEWHGPIRSGLGLHLIRIERRTEGRLPALAEIRPSVEREWRNRERIERRRALDERLLEGYEIIVDWSEEEVAARAAPERANTS